MDPFRADRIFALDERLTRQFEKVPTMLVRLRELRAVCAKRRVHRNQLPSTRSSGESLTDSGHSV